MNTFSRIPGETLTKAWIILRCSSSSTLRLAASLAEAGFDAWSPVETVCRRSRQGAKPEPLQLPMMKSYVFAAADRQQDLLNLSRSPSLNYRIWDSELKRMVTKGHPHFRLFVPPGECRPIPDHQLAPLRALERKLAPKPVVAALEVGARLRLTDGGFEGLWATVLKSRKSRTVLRIDNWGTEIDVPTWSLQAAIDAATDSGVSQTQLDKAA